MRCEYLKIRQYFKHYKILEKELECRTEYLKNFSKVLVNPLPDTEKTLRRIYERIIAEMEGEIKKLEAKIKLINKVSKKLKGPERDVIFYKYIMGIGWTSMPEYLMYEQRTCQLFEVSALKKIYEMNIDWSEFCD